MLTFSERPLLVMEKNSGYVFVHVVCVQRQRLKPKTTTCGALPRALLQFFS